MSGHFTAKRSVSNAKSRHSDAEAPVSDAGDAILPPEWSHFANRRESDGRGLSCERLGFCDLVIEFKLRPPRVFVSSRPHRGSDGPAWGDLVIS